VNEMLDYFESPYFGNAFIIVWEHKFDEFLNRSYKGFENEYPEGK